MKHGHVNVLEAPRTWSLETLRKMWSWVKCCTSSHDNCPKPLAASRLPLRLIDVMSTGLDQVTSIEEMRPADFDMLSVEESPNVRIISSTFLPLDTPYLTLSHRWGNPPSMILTKKTRFLLDDDITPYLLLCSEAAVFRHAIHVTRGLGYRYIWIDALCIIQDDGPEKTSEIMQMDEIYVNSTLNISATEAQCHQGLIFDRDILATNPCRATVRLSETEAELHLQAFPDIWCLRPCEGPLNERGWVFQERTLAPRIVHFTSNQVFWECYSLDASEVLPQGLPGEPPSRRETALETSSASTPEQVNLLWIELVEVYSGTSLSFADDRLLAFSAVAKRYCLRMGLDSSEYLAGIWKHSLPLSMLWSQDAHLSGPEPTSSVGSEMQHAPSWSWASIITRVVCAEASDLEATAEVLETDVIRSSPNFFGGTDTCRLRLRGQICKFRRHVQDGVAWIIVGQHTKFREFRDFKWQRGKSVILEWDTYRRIVSDFLNTDGNTPATTTHVLLHIATEDNEDGLIERGIVLQRTAAHGTYVRMGSFFIPFKSEYPGSELEDAFKGRLKTLCSDDYLELDSRGSYTIDVL